MHDFGLNLDSRGRQAYRTKGNMQGALYFFCLRARSLSLVCRESMVICANKMS